MPVLQVIVPLFITIIECWLRFGWNSEAIPQISHQPLLDTDNDGDGIFETTGFVWSTVAKLVLGALNALTFALAGYIVDNCSDMEFEAAFVWVLKHYHEVLVGKPEDADLSRPSSVTHHPHRQPYDAILCSAMIDLGDTTQQNRALPLALCCSHCLTLPCDCLFCDGRRRRVCGYPNVLLHGHDAALQLQPQDDHRG